MSVIDDEQPSTLPAFVTRVRHPAERTVEERHPVLALLHLLLRLPLVLLVILLWLSLFGLIRPLEWLYACARRQPRSTAPVTEALRGRCSAWIQRLL